nr:beta 3 protein, ClpB=NH2-terminus [Escherichia coli, Peptide Partial, 9 aa] [Escherichia coli]
MNDQGAEDQ